MSNGWMGAQTESCAQRAATLCLVTEIDCACLVRKYEDSCFCIGRRVDADLDAYIINAADFHPDDLIRIKRHATP